MTQRRATTGQAVIYCRQSKETDESTSIEDQERICRAWCEREGYKVTEVIIDRDTSGSDKEIPWRKRRHFPRVFDLDADLLLVYRWSRLSRDDFDQAEIVKKWGALGRDMQAATEPVDTKTASGYLHRSIILMFAAHEARQKSEMWKEIQAKRVAAGLPKDGVMRFGYMKDGKEFVPDPVAGPVLRDLYIRYTAGAGFQDLVRSLNEDGVRTTRGNTWGVQTLLRALDSGFGAGLLISKGKTHTFSPGRHEPVITPDEWTAYRDARTARRQLPTKVRTARWALSGIVVCGLCGGNMVSANNAKRLLRCSSYNSKRTCKGTWAIATQIENLTEFFLLGWKDQELAAVLSAERGAAVEQARAVASGRESDLERHQQALSRLATMYATGDMDDEAFRSAQAGLLQQRDETERDLRAARGEVARLAPVDDVLDRDNVGEMSPGEWGQRVGRVVRRIEVTKETFSFVPVVGEPMVFDR